MGLPRRSADEDILSADEDVPSDRKTAAGREGLRRLKVIGVVLPILFFLAIELIRLAFTGGGGFGFHTVLMLFIVGGVIAFSFVMFHFIERAQAETAAVVADLMRRRREGHGFYDVLLRISNREELADVLAALAEHARELLTSDRATVCLDDATAGSVQLDPAHSEAAAVRGMTESLQVPIRSRDSVLGELCIGRESTVPYTDRDRQFLATLADLASIAVTSAQMRESERQGAILAERERIARELHDSLAQVLGAVHLRLRALGSREDAGVTSAIVLELTELADVCEEGYRDARGAILDLHHSSQTDRDLLDSLSAYLDKYSHQCGIAISLETTLEDHLNLPPSSEIQIIRVIQEALTNVRKHSGAASAVVRIAQADGTVTFVIEDNGRGFDSAETLLDRDGFGLHSMRQRMELIGGTLLTDSASGRGTRVVATVPDAPTRAPIPSI